jgi:hypothetical protein
MTSSSTYCGNKWPIHRCTLATHSGSSDGSGSCSLDHHTTDCPTIIHLTFSFPQACSSHNFSNFRDKGNKGWLSFIWTTFLFGMWRQNVLSKHLVPMWRNILHCRTAQNTTLTSVCKHVTAWWREDKLTDTEVLNVFTNSKDACINTGIHKFSKILVST